MVRLALVAVAVVAFTAAGAPRQPLAYPALSRGSVVDTYYGTAVPDPYRSLEVASSSTNAWVEKETALTRAVLDRQDSRPVIAAAIHALHDIRDTLPPEQYGSRWFLKDYTARGFVLKVCAKKTTRCRVLLDGREIESDGRTQLENWIISPRGMYVAYVTTAGGSDSQTYRVRRVADGRDLPDVILGAKYWHPTWIGETAFYWEGYHLASDGSAVGPYSIFLHRLGGASGKDKLVYEPPSGKSWYSAIGLTEDHRYEIIALGSSEGYGKLWRLANAPTAKFQTLFPFKDASYAIFANEGPRLYIYTTDGAPNGRIVWVDIRDPHHAMHTIVPESSAIIDEARMVGDRIYVNVVRDVQSEVRIATKTGTLTGFVPLPQRGTATLAGSDASGRSLEFSFTSFTQPYEELTYDPRTQLVRKRFSTNYPFNPSAITVDQAFARSSDGTQVPYFVVHRRDMQRNDATPTILYGYGGFGLRRETMPAFDPLCAVWVSHGGAYAVANVRGGGEYGEAWHRAAILTHKQRSFDDFAAVARALHDSHVADRDHLGIYGISGGGLLVGAAETEHPELYGAVVGQSGLYDMLRYQKFGNERSWEPEDGASDRSEPEFQALAAYSPYNNVRDGTMYPATLILTGDGDDRVSSAHSYKFSAALQHAQTSPAPILLDVISGGGHNDNRDAAVEQRLTDITEFLSANLGLAWQK